jgi:hypothetical protein
VNIVNYYHFSASDTYSQRNLYESKDGSSKSVTTKAALKKLLDFRTKEQQESVRSVRLGRFITRDCAYTFRIHTEAMHVTTAQQPASTAAKVIAFFFLCTLR